MTTEEAVRRTAEKILGHIPVSEFRTMQHLNKTERIAAIILSELASLPSERDAGLEEAAQIADAWAQSDSCDSHDDNPCCHVRTGTTIRDEIRRRLTSPDGEEK